MKTRRQLCFRCLAGLSANLLAGTILLAAAPSLDLNVRSEVEPQASQALGAHPSFIMAPAVEVASGEKLVRPVAEATLMDVYRLLQEKLVAQGYVGVQDKTRPKVLVTIQYGRGHLPNPYTKGMTISGGDPVDGVPVGVDKGPTAGAGKMTGETGPTVILRGPMDYLRRHETDFQGKMQSAEQEKLFFIITAWDFASMRKGEKRVRYWSTTILTDDPDHRDLNRIYAEMITAGAEYFNRKMNREEVELTATVKEGRVEVGTPRVIPDAPKP